MSQARWVGELREKLAASDVDGQDEVEFSFPRRAQWRAAEAQRSVAYEMGEDHGYPHVSRRFEGESMVWTFRR